MRVSRQGRSNVECSGNPWDPTAGVAMKMPQAASVACAIFRLSQFLLRRQRQRPSKHAKVIALHMCSAAPVPIAGWDSLIENITDPSHVNWSHHGHIGERWATHHQAHAINRRGSETSWTLNLACVSLLYTFSAPERSHCQTAPGACSPEKLGGREEPRSEMAHVQGR